MGRYHVRVARVESLVAVDRNRATFRQRFLLATLGVALLGIASVGMIVTRQGTFPAILGFRDARSHERTVRVKSLDGQAELLAKGANGVRPIVDDAETVVNEGDRVRTGESSLSVLSFPTGQEVRLGAMSEVEILRTGVTQTEFTTVVLRRGQAWVISPLDQPTFEFRSTFATAMTTKGSFLFSLTDPTHAVLSSVDASTQAKSLVPWDESLPLIAQRDVDVGSVPLLPNSSVSIEQGRPDGLVTSAATDRIATPFSMINKELDQEFWRILRHDKDTTPPNITVDLVDGMHTNVELITLTGTTDRLAKIRVGDHIITTHDGSFSVPVHLSMGDNSVRVTATDPSGNAIEVKRTITRDGATTIADRADSVTLTGLVEEKGIRLSWSESRSKAFKEYIVLRSQLHPEPTIDNSSNLLVTSNRAEVGTFDAAVSEGTSYTYRVCVTDASNGSACSNAVKLMSYRGIPVTDAPPIARISANATGSVNVEMEFDGSTSVDDKEIVSYLWSFDDGTEIVGKKVMHLFTSSGSHRVKLTVIDGADHSHSTTITVEIN